MPVLVVANQTQALCEMTSQIMHTLIMHKFNFQNLWCLRDSEPLVCSIEIDH